MDESKLAPNLLARLRQPHALEADVPPVAVIVKYRSGVVRSHTVKRGVRARYVFRLTPTVAVTAAGSDILELTDDDSIETIWLDEEIHACLDRSASEIAVPAVWLAGYRGTGIRAAVVDTGIDPAHPDFAGRIVGGTSFVGSDYRDESGHGTHVAGILAGSGVASEGRYQGVAPEAALYIARVLDENGAGSMSDVMAGVEWAVEQQVHVINLSLGGTGPSDGQDALSLTCKEAVARNVTVCAAAGNSGPDSRTIGSPGAAPAVIAVGAVDLSGHIIEFSSRGPTADGRTKPDLCFPGSDVVSARAADTSLGEPVDTWYTAASGTSTAAPFASGLAALLLQAHPAWTPAHIREAMTETALDLGLDPNAQGAGRARADQALSWVEPVSPPPGSAEQPGCLPAFLISLLGR